MYINGTRSYHPIQLKGNQDKTAAITIYAKLAVETLILLFVQIIYCTLT